MQELLFLFMSSVLVLILVDVVSHVLKKLLDKWLDNCQRRWYKTHKRNSKKHRERR